MKSNSLTCTEENFFVCARTKIGNYDIIRQSMKKNNWTYSLGRDCFNEIIHAIEKDYEPFFHTSGVNFSSRNYSVLSGEEESIIMVSKVASNPNETQITLLNPAPWVLVKLERLIAA